jgi:SHS2 domain-containing protein
MIPWDADVREVYPFELKGKTIEEVYNTAANVMVIVFTDGTKVRVWANASEIEIKKG